LLHGICYKNKVYLYTNLKQLMLFVVWEDHLTKYKFIFMCLLPNIIFGFIPYILFWRRVYVFSKERLCCYDFSGRSRK
jgi:hypothetical protein